MRLGVLGESEVDESAIRILVGGILGNPIKPIQNPLRIRSRGVTSVLKLIPAFVKHCYYRTDADAIVIVVDSDSTSIVPAQTKTGSGVPPKANRLDEIRTRMNTAIGQITPIPSRMKLFSAAGLAVPALEAWLLCGVDHSVGEAAYQQSRMLHTRRGLKKLLYGSPTPPLARQIQVACEAATRLCSSLELLRSAFPYGFGALVDDVDKWKQQKPDPESPKDLP